MRFSICCLLLISVLTGVSAFAQDQDTLPEDVVRALDAAEGSHFRRLAETAATREVDEFWLEDNQANWSAVRAQFATPSFLVEVAASDAMSAMRQLYEMGGVELRPLYVWSIEWFDEIEREAEAQRRRMGDIPRPPAHPQVRQTAVDIVNEIDAILAVDAESAPSTEPATAPNPGDGQDSPTGQQNAEIGRDRSHPRSRQVAPDCQTADCQTGP